MVDRVSNVVPDVDQITRLTTFKPYFRLTIQANFTIDNVEMSAMSMTLLTIVISDKLVSWRTYRKSLTLTVEFRTLRSQNEILTDENVLLIDISERLTV